MANTACTIKDIVLITVVNGSKYEGPTDREGLELPEVQLVADFGKSRREYHCRNCGLVFDGSESFDETKKHFGTFPLTR